VLTTSLLPREWRQGFAVGATTVVGQLTGARRHDHACSAAGAASKNAALFMLPVAAAVYALAPRLAAWLAAGNALAAAATASYLRIIGLALPLRTSL
jgi:Na+-driven multidrug efflux pump